VSKPEPASNWTALHSCTIASTRGTYQAKHIPNRTPGSVHNTKAKAAACVCKLQVATRRRLLYRIWAASTNKRRTDAKHALWQSQGRGTAAQLFGALQASLGLRCRSE